MSNRSTTASFPTGQTLSDISKEVIRGRTKFPGNRYLLPALVEEVGELCEAIVSGDKEAIRCEATQVAAVAIRIIEEGDASVYEPIGFAGLVSSVGNVARFLMQRKAILALRALEDASNHIRALCAGEDETFNDITDEEAQP